MISIEESIFKNLLFNKEYANTVVPNLKPEYFQGFVKILFNIYLEQYNTYSTIPTVESIAIALNKEKIGADEFEGCIEFVESCIATRDEKVDTQWLIDETEAYCRDRAIYDAIYSSIDILEGKDKKHDKFAIPRLLDDALAISFTNSLGTEFFDDAERRYEYYTSEDSKLEMPIDSLTYLSHGGLRKKTLSAILAGINVGKSAMMCFLAGEWLKMGKNVVYFTLEMSEEEVHQRIEANLLDISTDDLRLLSKEEYLRRIANIKKRTVGKFYVKEYPTGGGNATHFKNFALELTQKKGIVPDVILVDYINIMASFRLKSMAGVNSYSYIKAIAEELRGVAVELNVPILTATQVSRDNYKNMNPDMTATSESWGLPASLDWFMTLVQDDLLASNSQQLALTIKTRWGNKAKLNPRLLNVDFDRMRYTDVPYEREGLVDTSELKSKVEDNSTGKNTIDFS